MANPRIEEVDDVSDPDEMDLDAFDFARPGQTTLQQAQVQQQQQRQQQQQQPNADMMAQMQAMFGGQGGGNGGGMPQVDQKERMRLEREQQEKSKSYQCIYPIYFDASRSREEGRRVKKEDAVRNPLARDIVDALQHIAGQVNVALQIVFEPSKCHPKDWANPGRVRVLVKKGGEVVTAKVANSELSSSMWKSIVTWERQELTVCCRAPPLQDDRIVPQITPYD
jgi:signal recognition particle subunit SRP19